MIFNLVVGTADAHGKNLSLLYDNGGPQFAPLYDLLSTVAYPELSPKLAMKIGNRATLAEMDSSGWAAFAVEAGLGLPLVRRRIAELTLAVRAQADAVAAELMRPGLASDAPSRLADTVRGRAERCALTFRKE